MTNTRNNELAEILNTINKSITQLRDKYGKEESSKDVMILLQVLIESLYPDHSVEVCVTFAHNLSQKRLMQAVKTGEAFELDKEKND